MGTGPYSSSYPITKQRGWLPLHRRATGQYVPARLSAYIPLREGMEVWPTEGAMVSLPCELTDSLGLFRRQTFSGK